MKTEKESEYFDDVCRICKKWDILVEVDRISLSKLLESHHDFIGKESRSLDEFGQFSSERKTFNLR